jgi:hypothetical protein
MSYFAVLEVGQWLTIAGCISIIIVSVGIKGKARFNPRGSVGWVFTKSRPADSEEVARLARMRPSSRFCAST